ncbi:MAG TPA: hypothetical protein VF095_06080 [Bacillota bacterium]
MIRRPPLWDTYLFIRKNRFRKKIKMYKMVFQMFVDRTIAIYLFLLSGYAIIGLFIAGDFIRDYEAELLFIDKHATTFFWSIAVLLPLWFFVQSFRHPGVLFSSSEDQLSLLPYPRQRIWWLVVYEKWLKQLMIYGMIGLFLMLFTPFSSVVVLQYMLLFIVMNVLMTIPQWKLFHTSVVMKIIFGLFFAAIAFIGLLTFPKIAAIMLVMGIFMLNVRFSRTLFHDIQWGRVVELSDEHIWKMPLIDKASGITYRRKNKHRIFRNIPFLKKPFTYTTKAIHRRLWMIYFSKQIDSVLKLIGSLAGLLIVLAFVKRDWLMWLGIVISVSIYSSVIARFFKDHFQSDLLNVLPWDLSSFKKTCLQWVWIGSIPILIPLVTYMLLHISFWTPFQLLFIYYSFLFLYHTKIDHMIALLNHKYEFFQKRHTLGLIFLLMIFLCSRYPFLSLGFVFVLWSMKKWNRRVVLA